MNWRKSVVGEKIKPITWNSYLRHINAVYKFGIEQGLLQYKTNPCNKLNLRVGKGRRKILSSLELNKLDFFLKSESNIPRLLNPIWFIDTLVKTFRFTAIRRSQLVKLKISDVDLEKRIIYISPEINKNHCSHSIPISDKLFPHIEKLVIELRKYNQIDSSQLFNFNLFCPSIKARNKTTTVDQISHIFRVISRYIGIQVSPHRFRHTVATKLMKDPKNLYITKQLLGHKDIKVTLTYIEDDVEMLRESVNSLIS